MNVANKLQSERKERQVSASIEFIHATLEHHPGIGVDGVKAKLEK